MEMFLALLLEVQGTGAAAKYIGIIQIVPITRKYLWT